MLPHLAFQRRDRETLGQGRPTDGSHRVPGYLAGQKHLVPSGKLGTEWGTSSRVCYRKELSVAVAHDRGFPGASDSQESSHNAGDLGSIPGSGGSP